MLSRDIKLVPAQQRLRCASYVINLVCKAILYGTNVDCVNDVIREAKKDNNANNDALTDLVSDFENALRTKDEQAKLKIQRKKGPISKLHNIVVYVRATLARREFFKQKQKEADNDVKRLYQLVVNGGIRQNSTRDIIERAIKLKDAIKLYQMQYRSNKQEPLKDDILTNDDWLELNELLQLLNPLKQMSLCV